MSDNVSTLPEPGVVLDLDAYERPASEVKPLFKVRVGEKVITFADPNEISWQDLASVQIPSDLFSVSLSPEDRKHIRGLNLPTFKFAKLMQDYYDYYEFEEKVRAAQRQQRITGL